MPAHAVTGQAPPTLPLLERIRRGIIGDDEVMDGPYGRHGHRLLPEYRFDPHTGGWHHRRAPAGPPLSLTDLTWEPDGRLTVPDHRVRTGEHVLADQLSDARTLLAARSDHLDEGPTGLPADFERMRWFHLPPACVEQTRPSTRWA